MNNYFIEINGEQKGPFTLEELKDIGVNESSSVWKEGLSDWVNASSIDELKPIISKSPPPLPKQGIETPSPPIKKKTKDQPNNITIIQERAPSQAFGIICFVLAIVGFFIPFLSPFAGVLSLICLIFGGGRIWALFAFILSGIYFVPMLLVLLYVVSSSDNGTESKSNYEYNNIEKEITNEYSEEANKSIDYIDAIELNEENAYNNEGMPDFEDDTSFAKEDFNPDEMLGSENYYYKEKNIENLDSNTQNINNGVELENTQLELSKKNESLPAVTTPEYKTLYDENGNVVPGHLRHLYENKKEDNPD